MTHEELVKLKIKSVKDNQRINSSIYKENLGIVDIIRDVS